MAFNELETSVADGKPITLYDFYRGNKHFRFTNADRDVQYEEPVHGLVTYYARAISDDGVSQSGQSGGDDFKVTLPTNTGVVDMYKGSPPSDTVMLNVRRAHFGDSEAPISWVGLIQQVRQKSAAESQITLQTLSATMRRDGLRLAWDRQCPHMLYDKNCRVDKELHKVIVPSVTVFNGIELKAPEIASKPHLWASGGFVEWDLGDGVVERRPIEVHYGDHLVLLGFTDGLVNGMSVRFYAGCFRTIEVCHEKFDNTLNYGGFPHLPGDSPFSGNPIF